TRSRETRPTSAHREMCRPRGARWRASRASARSAAQSQTRVSNWPSAVEAQEDTHPVELLRQLAHEPAIARRPRLHIAKLRPKLAILHREIPPTDHFISPQHRQ